MLRPVLSPILRPVFEYGVTPRKGGGAFNPLTLEPVWFANFSDTDTMYLTNAGSTEVASDGDTVGTLLEVSQWDGQTLAQVVAAATELVTNGGFDTDADWTKGSGWTISGGVAAHVTGASGALTSQGGSATVGKSYIITFTATVAAGLFNVSCGGFTTPNISTSGTYSYIAVASLANTVVPFAASTFEGSIDNISVKEILGKTQKQTASNARPKWYAPDILRWDALDDVLPGLPAPTASGTIALKMQPSTANRVVMGCQNVTPDRLYLGLYASGQLAAAVGSDGFATIHGDTDIVTAATAGVAVLTWDATGGVQLYWDGAEVYTGALNGSIPTAVTMSLGALNNNGTDASFFGGDVIGKPIVLDSYSDAAAVAKLTTYLNL